MVDPGPDFGRQYASQVLLDPTVNGAGNVQDALDALGDSGVTVNLQVDTGGLLQQLNTTFPLNLDGTSNLGVPWGFGAIAVPGHDVAAMGVVLGPPHITFPDFVASATGQIVASIYVTDVDGTNTATLDLEVLAATTVGLNNGGAQSIDFGTHPPTLHGADLTVVAGNLQSTAGGFFSAVVMMGFEGD